MVTPAGFLAELEAAGVRFRVEGDRLLADAPAGVVTADRAAFVGRHRVELIALVAGRGCERAFAASAGDIAERRRRWMDDAGNPLCVGCGRIARRDGMHGCPACDPDPTGPAARWA